MWGDMANRIDLGHDHYVWFSAWSPDRELNPQYEGIESVDKFGLTVEHPSKSKPGEVCRAGITFDTPTARQLGVRENGLWQVVSLEPETLHIEPSLLCMCGDHGFIRNGRWVPA